MDTFAKQKALTRQGFFGIRAFYALSANNEIKYNREWYNDMLELELQAAETDAFRSIAFFHHLVYKKR